MWFEGTVRASPYNFSGSIDSIGTLRYLNTTTKFHPEHLRPEASALKLRLRPFESRVVYGLRFMGFRVASECLGPYKGPKRPGSGVLPPRGTGWGKDRPGQPRRCPLRVIALGLEAAGSIGVEAYVANSGLKYRLQMFKQYKGVTKAWGQD